MSVRFKNWNYCGDTAEEIVKNLKDFVNYYDSSEIVEDVTDVEDFTIDYILYDSIDDEFVVLCSFTAYVPIEELDEIDEGLIDSENRHPAAVYAELWFEYGENIIRTTTNVGYNDIEMFNGYLQNERYIVLYKGSETNKSIKE